MVSNCCCSRLVRFHIIYHFILHEHKIDKKGKKLECYENVVNTLVKPCLYYISPKTLYPYTKFLCLEGCLCLLGVYELCKCIQLLLDVYGYMVTRISFKHNVHLLWCKHQLTDLVSRIEGGCNVCWEIGWLFSFAYFFGWVACQCSWLAPRWCHFGQAILPPEWRHFLFTSGITNLSLCKHLGGSISVVYLCIKSTQSTYIVCLWLYGCLNVLSE